MVGEGNGRNVSHWHGVHDLGDELCVIPGVDVDRQPQPDDDEAARRNDGQRLPLMSNGEERVRWNSGGRRCCSADVRL